MDSSQIASNKSPLLIGRDTTDFDSTNPNPPLVVPIPDSTLGDFSNQGVKREHDVDDVDTNLCIKKSRTENNSNVVALNAKPLAIVEPVAPKLSRQFWKAGDEEEDVPVPHYCNIDTACFEKTLIVLY